MIHPHPTIPRIRSISSGEVQGPEMGPFLEV